MEQLLSLIPDNSRIKILKILRNSKVSIKIKKKRLTKHGDFSIKPNGTSLITINISSNPYRFLITLIHELAHFRVYNLYPYRVKPHGIEWKSIYREIFEPFLSTDIFPEPICSLLAKHMINPKASTDRDFKLAMALREYDSPNQHTTIYHLKEGNQFALDNGRIFTKIKKRRKLFECVEKDTGKTYLFNPQSEVRPIKN